jgi:hypothetical protein
MKFSTEIVIHLPRRRVVELFDNPDILPAWQPGLEKYELLSGKPGQPGARARLVYRRDRREIEMIETVTSRNLPEEYSTGYQTKEVKNLVVNRFEELEGGFTRWITENEFKFSGWMAFLAIFLRPAFRRQILDDMERFKAFAEGTIIP